MNLKVLLFGIAKDIAGHNEIAFDIEKPITVKQFKEALQEQYPDLESLAHFAVAVNQEFASESQVIKGTDEIALLPPVSGG
ncbi:MAG: molybdopterin converting factor subunit 1 [Cyclobacteriaceae bacterium]